MVIQPGSAIYILIAINGPDKDYSQYPAAMALIPVPQAENGGPEAADWKPATWLPVGGRNEVAAMSTTWPAGEYIAYGRVTGDTEQPVMISGRVTIK